MKVEQFATLANLVELKEIERVELLAFYFAKEKGQPEFTVPEITSVMTALSFAKPNVTRLVANLRKSRNFVRGSSKGAYRISAARLAHWDLRFQIGNPSEEIVSDDSLLPEILFTETRRTYLVRIAQQINAAYENNLFDACALMMRRLMEVLIIKAFAHAGIETDAVDSDGIYLPLKGLINMARSRGEIGLTADTRRNIDQFRELGNLSAHKEAYICRRDDIRPLRMEYRAIIEELIEKAGLRPVK